MRTRSWRAPRHRPALEGLTRHASTHAAGIVIGDRPLSETGALYRIPNPTCRDQFQHEMGRTGGAGQFDFLGLKNADRARRCVKLLSSATSNVDLTTLPSMTPQATRCWRRAM